MKMLYPILCLFMCQLFLFFVHSSAQDTTLVDQGSKEPYRIPFIKGQVKVDGYLNEPIWEDAVIVEANIEVSPGENIEAPVKTIALIAYDQEHIYAGFRAFDPNPEDIQAHLCDRDNIWDDDWVLILFDTFNDQRRTYDFACNPFGIQADIIESPAGGGGSWDAIWESKGRITEDGYVVEMVIPFRSLGFPRTQGEQIWGFDVVRSYPRKVRHHIGAFPRDRDNNCYMCQAVKMAGFIGATPGRNIEFDPTLSAIYSRERQDWTSGPFIDHEKNAEPGLTASWGFTPNLTLAATLNPDFSNIEADILQLDINNQFALFYPEKRPFFLKGADFFSMPLYIVHTRTLADPDWGAKITGKEGPNGIGFFTVRDRITNFLIPGSEGSDSESMEKKSYGSVFRYKRDIFKSSNIGLVLTDREGKDYFNRSGGIDADIKFTQKDRLMFQFMRSGTLYPDSIYINYDQPDTEFRGNAYQIYYGHNTKNYEIYGFYNEVDNRFRADLGFITQAGFSYSEAGATYMWRKEPGHWYTWFSIHNHVSYTRDKYNNPLHKSYSLLINYEGPFRSHAHLYGEFARKLYDGERFRANYMTSCFGLWPLPSLWIHVYWRYGDQIDYTNTQAGTSLLVNPSLTLNAGLHYKVELGHTTEKMNVDAGHLYTANISFVKMIYQFNRRMFLRTIFQFMNYKRNTELYEDEETDPESSGLFTQYLFSYKINPQTVFFLGYSDNYEGGQIRDMTQTNKTLFVKIGYAFII